MGAELAEAMRTAVNYALLGVHTALPGRVESYDGKKAKVKPLVKRVLADGRVESLPVLPAVPVVFPRTAAGSLTFKLAKGDGVLLVFAERAIERWLSHGGEQEPGKPRHHDLSDAIAIPGLYPFAGDAPGGDADMVLTAGGVTVKMDGGKIAISAGGVDILDLLSQLMNAVATGNVTAVGAPLSTSAAVAVLKTQLDAVRGSV